METLQERIRRVVSERIEIVPYDPAWPAWFLREKEHLLACLPRELLGRIEHFGSTAVPGMAAKPVVDMLVEVTDLDEARARIAPLLESQGYDYFWRPSFAGGPPFYAWFIRRDAAGRRTHHLHAVEGHFAHWDALALRDYLIARPEKAREYEALKRRLAAEHPNDREAYTNGKAEFIARATAEARRFATRGGAPPPSQ